MRILELNNKKTYEITESEAEAAVKASQQRAGGLISFPRIQLVVSSFSITSISPIPYQLDYGLPYKVWNAEGKQWRAFLYAKRYIFKSETEGSYSLGTKEELEEAGYSVRLEEELLIEKWKELKLELEAEAEDAKNEKVKRLSKTNP